VSGSGRGARRLRAVVRDGEWRDRALRVRLKAHSNAKAAANQMRLTVAMARMLATTVCLLRLRLAEILAVLWSVGLAL